jgi:chitinase
MSSPSCLSTGCPFTSGGKAGPCTHTVGILSADEIRAVIAAGGTTTTTDPVAAVQIVTWGGNQWVSYDDAQTFKTKINYANSRCLGG